VDNQCNAVRGAKDVGCVHRISGDPFDCRGSGLRAAGQTSHRPSTPRERRGGRTSNAARGTDNEGNLAGRMGHLGSPFAGERQHARLQVMRKLPILLQMIYKFV
jgi:hypothetical protein